MAIGYNAKPSISHVNISRTGITGIDLQKEKKTDLFKHYPKYAM